MTRTNGARSVGDKAQSNDDAHAGARNNGMTQTTPNQTSEGEKTLSDYAGVLRRRKGIVLTMAILVPLIALVFSLRQSELYEGSAEVLLQRQDAVNALAGVPTQGQQDPQRYAETQAQLAESPQVADRTLRAARIRDMTSTELLGNLSVQPAQNSDLLEFKVRNADPALATRLARTYGEQFALYRRDLDSASVTQAQRDVDRRLAELEDKGQKGNALYENLVDKRRQLNTIETLQTSNVQPVRAAGDASKVRPRPVRNVLIGLIAGLLLGITFAFLREALDNRVRSGEEIGERLGLRLLGRIPQPPRPLRVSDQLVTIADPGDMNAEAYRMLRTNFDFSNLERGHRKVLVTSAVETEGKSTTISNLAVAIAQSGRTVALVDADLRRPYVHRFFDVGQEPGLTDVALGNVDLEEALHDVSVGSARLHGRNGDSGDGAVVRLLTAGTLPMNASEFVESQAVAQILDDLLEHVDYVLVDTPPLLNIGDALALSARVDAMILVTRLRVVREPMIPELRRLLAQSPAEKLGFVLTDSDQEPGGSYYYASGRYGRQPEPPRERESSRARALGRRGR